jgi:hypothetical protein
MSHRNPLFLCACVLIVRDDFSPMRVPPRKNKGDRGFKTARFCYVHMPGFLALLLFPRNRLI